MQKFGRIIGSAAVLLAATATAAHADLGGLVNGTQYCGGNAFSTCATVTNVSYSGGVVTLTVANTSGNAGSVFTAIGLANIGGTFAVTNFTATSGTAAVHFSQGTNSLRRRHPGRGHRRNADSPPPTNGLQTASR